MPPSEEEEEEEEEEKSNRQTLDDDNRDGYRGPLSNVHSSQSLSSYISNSAPGCAPDRYAWHRRRIVMGVGGIAVNEGRKYFFFFFSFWAKTHQKKKKKKKRSKQKAGPPEAGYQRIPVLLWSTHWKETNCWTTKTKNGGWYFLVLRPFRRVSSNDTHTHTHDSLEYVYNKKKDVNLPRLRSWVPQRSKDPFFNGNFSTVTNHKDRLPFLFLFPLFLLI